MTPDELDKQLREAISLQNTVGNIADEFKKANAAAGGITTEMQNIQSLSTELNNLMKDSVILQAKVGKEYIKIENIEKEINKYKNEALLIANKTQVSESIASKAQKANANIARNLNQGLIVAQKEIVDLQDRIAKGETKASNGRNVHLELMRQMTETQKAQRILQNLNNDATVRQLSTLYALQDATAENVTEWEKLKGVQELHNDGLDKSKKSLGSLGALMKGLHKIPILGDLIDTQKVLDKMQKTLDTTGSKWKAFGTGLKSTAKEIDKLSTDFMVVGGIMLGFLAKLLDGVMEFDKLLTTTANTLAIGKYATQAIYRNYRAITIEGDKQVKTLNEAFLSINNQGKALNDLNDAFGTSIIYTEKTVQNQILLTKQMGLSAEEAASIQQYAILTHKSAEDTLQTIIKQNKSVLSYRKVIGEVAKLSGQILAQYQGNPEALAKAVVQANMLGMSLEQAKKVSDSLLDFQSSIESELEAELLTGKQINLEKARSLALAGKSSEAAQEMLEQVGDFNSYSKLNVIQQQSMAKAIGMNADELTNTLRQQQTLKDLGQESLDGLTEQYNMLRKNNDIVGLTALQEQIRSKQNGDILLKQIAQTSLQQRFQESMEKIEEAFVNIAAGPLLKLMNGMASLVSHATALKTVLIGAGAAMSFIATRSIVMAMASVIKSMAEFAGPAGVLAGTVAAGVVGYNLYSMLNKPDPATPVQDALISPKGGITISTPKGMIVPDKNDHIIATTDPEGLLNSDVRGKTTGATTNNDGTNKEMVSLLSEIRDHIRKGGSVYMDSHKVGTSMGLSYSSYA
jgi:hypothetical protein